MSAARQVNYQSALRDWARYHGLIESSRRARCGHGLLGRNGPCEDPQCRQRRLIDHATLWNRDGSPVLLLVHVLAPTTFKRDEPGQMREWWESEVHRYAVRFGARAWIGRPEHPLSIWDRGRCTPVLYGRGLDPSGYGRASEHDTGVRRHRRRAPETNSAIPTPRRARP